MFHQTAEQMINIISTELKEQLGFSDVSETIFHFSNELTKSLFRM